MQGEQAEISFRDIGFGALLSAMLSFLLWYEAAPDWAYTMALAIGLLGMGASNAERRIKRLEREFLGLGNLTRQTDDLFRRVYELERRAT